MPLPDAPPAVVAAPPPAGRPAVHVFSPTTPAPPRPPLIGEFLTRPLHLLWVGTLPQAFLLWINARAYALVSGEMNSGQKMDAALLLAGGLTLLLGTAALGLWLRTRGRPLAWSWNWGLLAASVGYLGLVAALLNQAIPSVVPAWILSGGDLSYYQFVLTMPLVFYAVLRLACFETHRWPAADSLGACVGFGFMVAVGGIFVTMGVGFFLSTVRGGTEFSGVIAVIISGTVLIAAATALLGALVRGMAIVYAHARRDSPGAMAGLTALVALLGPAFGLLLNRGIPFPADFQGWEVYALTGLNAALLLLPAFRHPLAGRLVWLAQCALFPFSLYFFLVFLPVLPLAPLAMIWLGAGFLLLVPTALFAVHAQRLVDGYRCEVRDGGPRRTAALGIAAALLLPVLYAGGALADRVVLRHALDLAYGPDLRAGADAGETGFKGSPRLVGRTLENLRDFKAGLNLPFLTDFYKAVVFNNLVLPEEKMQHLHRVFLGRDLPAADASRVGVFSNGDLAGGRRRQTRERADTPRLAPPPATAPVVLTDLARVSTPEGPCERTRLTLTMDNTGTGVAEFVTRLRLPETVRVVGFTLHIGAERVPGRLIERKTARWVYGRIRDAVVPQDPGLVLYTDPGTVELRIYPFAAGERRTAELELLCPAGLPTTVTLGDRALPLGAAAGDGASVAAAVTPAGADGATVSLPTGILAKLPTVRRTPVLHFLLDRSAAGANATDPAATLLRAVETAVARFPDAREVLVTAVNYESHALFPAGSPVGLNRLRAELRDDAPAFARRLPPARGGFLAERALQRGLLRERDAVARAADAGDASLSRFPVFIVVPAGPDSRMLPEPDELGGGGLAAWASLAPELGAYFVAEDAGGKLSARSFASPAVELGPAEPPSPRPVVLLRAGNETVAVCAIPVASGPALVRFTRPAGAPPALGVFDPAARGFRPLADVLPGSRVSAVPPDSTYAGAVRAFLRHRALVENPSGGNVGLAAVAALSRASGSLVGATSFIVVENRAQWAILERKEKEKLANAPALEIEQVPEPATWALLLAGGGALAWLGRRRHARRGH